MRGFETPDANLSGLPADAVGDLIAASSDITLIMDGEGIIRDMAFGSDDLSQGGYREWLGKPWIQTTTVESRPKVEALLRDIKSGAAPVWRHINHPSATGVDLPLLYTAVRVREKGKSKSARHTIAFGRDLRANAVLQQRLIIAQQAMERDYWRLRHMETRYRALFQVSSEAVAILSAVSLKLEEANPAAVRLFGEASSRPGWSLIACFEEPSVEPVRAMLARVETSGIPENIKANLAGHEGDFFVFASLFKQEKSSHLLVRLERLQRAPESAQESASALLARVVNSTPDAFVVTDPDGRVLAANAAFLELAQINNEQHARGMMLDTWLGRTGVDVSVLISNLKRLNTIRLFSTTLRGAYGACTEVEISAVSLTDGEPQCLGFTIRDISRRLVTVDARASREIPRSVGQMAELVGRVPLKDIVRDTTDLIEQLCIEAALQLTQDNRASAAEILGLSRQSLYVKLRRFGMTDPAVLDED